MLRRTFSPIILLLWPLLVFPVSNVSAVPEDYLHLEKARALDESYQRDRAEYANRIKRLRYLLSVRACDEAKKVLRSAKVYIMNLGRAEAHTEGNEIYLDMALLDLVDRLADQLSVADIKEDSMHQLVFNLAYAKALNGDKKLNRLDPLNTVKLTEEQNLYLWNGKLRAERVIFDNLLGFILAHEMSHLVLMHQHKIQQDFPDPKTRTSKNTDWIQFRRKIELEADEFGARLCLDALIQPAQVVMWIDLNEIRRRFYGKSVEYPTSAQRIAVIEKVYREFVPNGDPGIALSNFNPLPPDRDVTQGDYQLFLDEFQKVRKFGQGMLVELDRISVELAKQGYTNEDIANTFIGTVEQQKDLLKGVENEPVLDELILLISNAQHNAQSDASIDLDKAKALVNDMGVGPYALAMLTNMLASDPINWEYLGQQLVYLKAKRDQFLFALNYPYLVGNTMLRWLPETFSALQQSLPESESRAKKLKPYVLGKPFYNESPTFSQRVETLKLWDGKYPGVE